MATNNATNLSTSGLTYYDDAGSYTGIDVASGAVLAGRTSLAPVSQNLFMMQGNNCWFWNLSFTHSAGTLTIAGGDGTALSASNPAYLVMPSNASTGRLVQHKITSNQTLTVSDMTGNIGNMTASTAYSTSFPLWIGFMADSSDANLVGVVTWAPNCRTSPSTSTNIGDPSSATADKTYSVFSFDDITESNYTSKEVGLIGSLTATKDSSDIYTLDSLNNGFDGVGKWNDNRYFSFAGGLFGNDTNAFFYANGGTPPIWSNSVARYAVQRDGRANYSFYSNTANTSTGSGAVDAILGLPYEAVDLGLVRQVCGPCRLQSNNIGQNLSCTFINQDDYKSGRFYRMSTFTTPKLQDFNNSNDFFSGRWNFIIRGVE